MREARAQRRGGDPGALQLAGQALGEGRAPRLGGGVGPHLHERRHRRDVDDGPSPPLAHRQRRGLRHHEHRAGVDHQVVLLPLDRGAQEVRLEAVAGVVDDEVHRACLVGDPVRHALQLVALGDVRDEDLAARAVQVPQVVGDLLQPVAVAGDQDEVVAAAGQLTDEGQADAGGRAGDECGCHERQRRGSARRLR